MKNFDAFVKGHLSNYRKANLKGSEPGPEPIFRGKILDNSTGKYEYILHVKDKEMNFLPSYKTELKKYIDLPQNKMKFHIYFHHLNSSQAMCFNFFYPLIHEKKLELILEAMGINELIDYEKTSFEKISASDRTNFDFYIELQNNKHIYFEIKYTENEFGKTNGKGVHEAKFIKTYAPMLNKSTIIRDECKEMGFVFHNYQMMRNLIIANDDNYLVFLYPENNDGVNKAVKNAISNIVKPNIKSSVFDLTWDKLLEHTINNTSGKLKQYYIYEFKDKYIL